jgi:branched-chain amino acid transport system ATP-binding protein
MPLLEVRHLQVRYGQILGTGDVSLALEEGRSLALVGSNGAGKSSTLRAIVGLAPIHTGDILLDGWSIRGMATDRIVQLGIGLSPEGRRVFPQMTVADNLNVGGYHRSRPQTQERAAEIFEYFPRLKERARQLAGSLSGGEQQMLAIGRALMARPRLFLLDEPSLGLAPIVIERIGEILKMIQQRERVSIMLAEQNAAWALRIADDAVVLEMGVSQPTKPAREMLRDPEMRRAYLGV